MKDFISDLALALAIVLFAIGMIAGIKGELLREQAIFIDLGEKAYCVYIFLGVISLVCIALSILVYWLRAKFLE